MNNAKLLSSIEDAYQYLTTLELASDKTYKAKNLLPSKYSKRYYNTFHEGDYTKTFIIASEENDYDIILNDGSFFQFTARNDTDIHYSFFPRIERTLTYDEYFGKYANDDNVESIDREYEYYLSTDREKTYPCPIRFDVAKSEYKEGTHAYAHLHIGIDTNIRIPFDKVIKPLSFVDFVVKNTYKQEWDKAYLYNEDFKELVEALKNQSEEISEDSFTYDERKLIFIT